MIDFHRDRIRSVLDELGVYVGSITKPTFFLGFPVLFIAMQNFSELLG